MANRTHVLNGIDEACIVFHESAFSQWIAVELIDIDRPHSLVQVFQDESVKLIIRYLQNNNSTLFNTGSAIVEITCQDDQVCFTVKGGYRSCFDYSKIMHFLLSHFS